MHLLPEEKPILSPGEPSASPTTFPSEFIRGVRRRVGEKLELICIERAKGLAEGADLSRKCSQLEVSIRERTMQPSSESKLARLPRTAIGVSLATAWLRATQRVSVPTPPPQRYLASSGEIDTAPVHRGRPLLASSRLFPSRIEVCINHPPTVNWWENDSLVVFFR